MLIMLSFHFWCIRFFRIKIFNFQQIFIDIPCEFFTNAEKAHIEQFSIVREKRWKIMKRFLQIFASSNFAFFMFKQHFRALVLGAGWLKILSLFCLLIQNQFCMYVCVYVDSLSFFFASAQNYNMSQHFKMLQIFHPQHFATHSGL